MAVIHIISLDADTERAIKNKRYSEEQVIELNDKLQADNVKKKKIIWIVMISFSVFFFTYGIFVLNRSVGSPEAIPIVLSFFPIIAISGFIIWFASIGNIMRQWNSLIRMYYPFVYTMCKNKTHTNAARDTSSLSDTSDSSDTSKVSNVSDTPVNNEEMIVPDTPERDEKAEFIALEKDIEQLNKINVKANYTSRDRYLSLYQSIYERLLEMDKKGEIVLEPGTKGLGYLQELLINDGPEFSYIIRFWRRGRKGKRYRIGVCVRGLPICKPDK